MWYDNAVASTVECDRCQGDYACRGIWWVNFYGYLIDCKVSLFSARNLLFLLFRFSWALTRLLLRVDFFANVSYSQAARQVEFPKKDQAIILEAIDGFTSRDYALAHGKVINPTDMISIVHISNKRMIIVLSSKELAGKVTDETTKINIKGITDIEIHSYIPKTKRIILSNVFPWIPASLIENKLNEHGITLPQYRLYEQV